jgi:predicted dehydrogenase
MQINVVGDGSAGQRHARILRELGHEVRLYGPLDSLDRHDKCRAVVIASPPENHKAHLMWYWNKCHILCEGPVTYCGDQVLTRKCMTAENWLFVPAVKRLIDKCRDPFPPIPVHAHLYFDYDLEKWRPGVDMRSTCYYYSGIDMINVHELMMAFALFGHPIHYSVEKVHTGKSLGTDALTVNTRHPSNVVCTINSAWHSSVYRRGIRIAYDDGSLDEVSWQSPQDDPVVNASYRDMLVYWLQCIEDDRRIEHGTLYDGYAAYNILMEEY